MAISRINPFAVKKLVSTSDPAIDKGKDKSNLDKYRETLDLKHLVFLEGQHPTYFLAKNILVEKKIELSDKHMVVVPPTTASDGSKVPAKIEFHKQSIMALRYFTESVHSIEEEGVVKAVTPDEFTHYTIQEIGSFVFTWSQLGDDLKKT